MIKELVKNTDKKRVNMLISRSVLKELNYFLVDQYGNVFGHIGESFEEGIKLWLKTQKANLVQGEAECQIQ